MRRTLACLVHGQWTWGDGAGGRAAANTWALDTPWPTSGIISLQNWIDTNGIHLSCKEQKIF